MTDVISQSPPRPVRGGDDFAFSNAMDLLVDHIVGTFTDEVNAFSRVINNFSLVSSSSDSLDIEPGFAAFNLDINKGYLPGMPIRMVALDDPTNYMQGDVLSYDIDTGATEANFATPKGSGTFYDWIVFSAGTMDITAQPVLTTGAQPNYVISSTLGDAFNLYEQVTIIVHATAVGTPTLARDGLPAKNIKQYDPTTASKVSGVLYANMALNLLYDGVDFVILNPVSESVRPGTIVDFAGIDDEPGYLRCPTAATTVLRASYPKLYQKLNKESVVTISIATPGVISWVAHGLTNGLSVYLLTTGNLPTGLVVSTRYYVINAATDSFQLSATRGGAPLGTGGAQAGVHTAICSPWGIGDGATTFNIPYFAPDHAAVQASGGNQGEVTSGVVKNHTHNVPVGLVIDRDGTGGGNNVNTGANTTTGNPSGGGSDNLAAGTHTVKFVKY